MILSLLAYSVAQSASGAEFVALGKAQAHSTRLLARFADRAGQAAATVKLSALGVRIERFSELAPGLVTLDAEDPQRKSSGRFDGLESSSAKLLERIRRLREWGLFEYVEPDYLLRACRLPGDARFVDGTLWGLRNPGSNGGVAGADIDAARAWEITTGSTNVIVAVVDSGIRYTHRELAAQMWRNPGEIPNNGLDDDDDGFVDNVYGINALNKWGDVYDESGHGTYIAGTIGAAANDGNPHVGVAWQVRLMACKFLDRDGFGFTSDAIRCIDFAIAKGSRIINASWVSGPYSDSLFDAIARARNRGVLFVAAAGNDDWDLEAFPSYPASYELDNIIAVAALDRRDQLAPASNFGKTRVHLGAPGFEIFSTASGSDQAYSTVSGTSMAAPYVSGVAALVSAHSGSALLPEIRNRILSTVVPITSLRDKTRTGGRLNAYGALTARPNGNLEVALFPFNGAEVRAGMTLPLRVTVADLEGITNATVSAQIDGVGEPVVFRNDGRESDALADDDTYSASIFAPMDRLSLVLKLRVNALGKDSFEEMVVYSLVSPPENDDFDRATTVPSGGGVFVVANKLATIEANEPLHAGDPSRAGSVWWRWSSTYNTSAMVDTSGSSFDTILAVYTNSTLLTLKEVAEVDDSGDKKQGYVIFDATAGVTYHIAVAGYSPGDVGTVRLRVLPKGAPDLRAPEVSIASPLSGLTVTSATENKIVITGTASDPGPHASGVEEVLVGVNDRPAIRASGTSAWSSTNALELGENTFKVIAVDFAHNASAARSLTVFFRPLLSPNDLFVNSTELIGRQGTVKAENTAATSEFGEPMRGAAVAGKSVWWHYRPMDDGLLSLSTEGSGFAAVLGLYSGNHVTNLTVIAESDNASVGVAFSQIRQAVKAFETYRIMADGWAGGSGTINLRYSFMPRTVVHLSISNAPGGSVSPPSGFYVQEERVVAVASPAPNYQFDSWEGSMLSRENPLTIVMTNDIRLFARFHPYEFSDGFESRDLKHRNWSSSGELPWSVQSQVVAFGGFAARSGLVGNGQTSSLKLVEECRAGTGSFQVRVSSEEGWDFLEFSLNGRRVNRWSGEVGWANFEFAVPAGRNNFEWRYSKDAGGTSAGWDAGFIDDLELPLVVGTDSTTPARLRLRQLGPYTFHLLLEGQFKQQYQVQRSENLTTWVPLSINVATNGVIQVIDSVSSNAPMRFYRAIVP